ncbi:MAG: Xaa-Pro peptidase family protein [Ruminococcus sp.]|nr:Xaa-Pro peptidase family protein [Ruminococcus sp.]
MDCYKNRIEKLKEKTENSSFLVTDDKNIYYFTGLWDSNGYLLVTQNEAYLFVDFRYGEVAENTVNSAKVIVFSKLYDEINNVLEKEKVENCFVETNKVTMEQFSVFKEKLKLQISKDNTLDEIIKDMRIIKDDYEITLLQKAQDIAEKAYKKVLPMVKHGVTEREISVELEHQMKLLGAQDISFDLITITGKKTSLPHGVPSDDKISAGDFFTFDIGATFMGYHSDMTRTVAVGSATDEMKKVYDIVLTSHKKALKGVKPGVRCSDIDNIARDYIYENGFEGCFGHATGHGVGLDIHEFPTVSTRCDNVLKKGMVITIEPGIYLKGKFGVRIEDTVVVTNEGYRSFASIPKELIIL